MPNLNFTLFGKQHQIMHDWLNSNKNCISVVPVGSGKSFLAALMLPIAASDPSIHKNKDVIYSAPTRTMIKNIIWKDLVKNCKEYFGVKDDDVNVSELSIKFPSGNYIKCLSAEQRERWRGLNVSLWVSDESALYPEAALTEITNRLRPRVGATMEDKGRVIHISTPNGAGPFYELFKAAKLDSENWIVHHYDYRQMKSGNMDFIRTQRKILSPLKFAVDFECSFETVADSFFYTFKPQFHTAELEDDGRSTLYSFHDFNKRVGCAVIARVINPGSADGRIEVLREFVIENCGTEQMAKAIREVYPKREIFSVIDISGSHVNRDTTSPFGVTDKTILEKYGFRILNMNKKNPLVSDTDNSSNALIARGGLIIDTRQTHTVDALKSYHYEDGSRKRLVKYLDRTAYIDGLGDSIRYGCHHFFPVTHTASSAPSQVWDQPRNRVGEEYLPDHKRRSNRGVPTVEHLLNPQTTGLDGCSWD